MTFVQKFPPPKLNEYLSSKLQKNLNASVLLTLVNRVSEVRRNQVL